MLTSFISPDMPKKRSKKGKSKNVVPAKEDQEMQLDEAGPSMPALPHEELSEKVETVSQPEKETERVEEAVVEEAVEEVGMTGIEDDGQSKSTREQAAESQIPETKKMTMEERRIKFNELRKKMVCLVVHYDSLS